jgi:2-dehydro-3-deoxyphosphogluconate aldolase/(4S)-4-hydroxy-2-oxoglutarate aldolase
LPSLILEEKVIPVVRGLTAERALSLSQAIAGGGLHSIEITLETAGSLEALATLADGEFTVGAGTVRTISQAQSAFDAGAEFLVSPHLDEELVKWARDRDIPYLPGVLTPTELAHALQLGIETVKVFPAGLGGPDLISALLGPFPGVQLIPTGGITADNAAGFIAKGAVAVGVGGWLTNHKDLTIVTARTRSLTQVV